VEDVSLAFHMVAVVISMGCHWGIGKFEVWMARRWGIGIFEVAVGLLVMGDDGDLYGSRKWAVLLARPSGRAEGCPMAAGTGWMADPGADSWLVGHGVVGRGQRVGWCLTQMWGALERLLRVGRVANSWLARDLVADSSAVGL
jgi:hypothetical protein